jgi:hypothetical protein
MRHARKAAHKSAVANGRAPVSQTVCTSPIGRFATCTASSTGWKLNLMKLRRSLAGMKAYMSGASTRFQTQKVITAPQSTGKRK